MTLRNTCFKFRFVVFQWDTCLRIERDMCVFSRRLQRHTTTTSFFNAHFHTHTHTHMTGQRWLTGQVVPDFSGFANIFDPKEVARNFLTARGSRNIRKYFQSVKNVSVVYVYIYAGIMLQLTVTLGWLLICKAQLLEINRAPTAG